MALTCHALPMFDKSPDARPEMVYADVLVIGAGHAGGQLACALRQKGFAGRILVVGEEDVPPYERPDLSKRYLLGNTAFDQLQLRPPSFWREADIDLRLGDAVINVDTATNTAQTEKGQTIGFHWCVFATGGRPRELSCPGADEVQVHYLRTRADADALRSRLRTGARAVIVGGGYIGLEVAAALKQSGCRVKLIEFQPRLLARAASPEVSEWIKAAHVARGIEVHCGVSVDSIFGNGVWALLNVSDGHALEADIVIAGIGIIPDDAIARRAGLDCDEGILVDAYFRTRQPNVLAIGDCARHPNKYADAMCRLESVQHAIDSAALAADVIMGVPREYDDLPWFWSDQFDLKLQSVGIARAGDKTIVRFNRHDSLSVVHLRNGQIVAAEFVNAPKEFLAAKRLIAQGAHPDPRKIIDPDVPLKLAV